MLTTPVIRAIRRARPAAHLSYLVEPQAAPVVLGNPHLDEVIVTPLLHGAARLREDAVLALRLRRARYDAVIDFHGGPRSSLLALATGAPRRIGYTIAGRSWMYTTQGPEAARSPPASLGREPVGPRRGAAARSRPAGARGTDPVEMREDAAMAAQGRPPAPRPRHRCVA